MLLTNLALVACILVPAPRVGLTTAALAPSSPLVIGDDGVIYADSFLQTPVGQGGLAILLNLSPLISTAGFQCGWNGWTWHTDLEEQSSWVADDALHFAGRLADGSTHFTLTPPPVDPGPNPPAVRYSHAGYLPRGEKQAVLEIDWRDAWPDLSAQAFVLHQL
jgi:hypothetical protein